MIFRGDTPYEGEIIKAVSRVCRYQQYLKNIDDLKATHLPFGVIENKQNIYFVAIFCQIAITKVVCSAPESQLYGCGLSGARAIEP